MAEQASHNQERENSSKQFECEKCQDLGFIITQRKSESGYYTDVARPCECRERKALAARLKNAMIPDEFQGARFDNYQITNRTQEILYNGMVDYIKNFDAIRSEKQNSLGFMAIIGEQKIKQLPYEQRKIYREQHNNYGLGKTHLTIAAAKWLIKNARVPDQYGGTRGCRVLCIQDVNFMEGLSAAKTLGDGGAEFNKQIDLAINRADVLVWDDLGKSKHTETREAAYYRIINARYEARKPIIFTTNEDADTLEDKIGFAAADRLFGMAKNYLYAVEGESFRTK